MEKFSSPKQTNITSSSVSLVDKNLLTSLIAISAACLLGNLYTPVLMLGKAMVLTSFSTASFKLLI